MSAWALAWRTVVHNPARAFLAIGGVAVIGALLFNMLMLSRGLLVSFRDLLDTAGYDVRVMGSEGSPIHRAPFSGAPSLADAIRRLPGVQRVALVRTDSGTVSVPGRDASPVGVTLIGSTESAIGGAWTIVKGSPLPAAVVEDEPPAVIVSTNLADLLHLVPGSALRIRVNIGGGASALPPLNCRVAGVGTFQFEGADDYTVAISMSGLAAARGAAGAVDDADLVLVASSADVGPEAAAKAIAALRPDVRVYSNAQVVEQFNARAFSYFRQISVVLSTITLAFAFLLVATLLTMSVNQRLGEVAALRALGFPRRRIAANLLCESALLVGVGGAAALPLGGILAVVLDRILRGMPGIPERLHFFVFEPRTVVLHAALLAATGLFAALYPIWLAARLPIAATLRREIVS
jgi:ABC-type lipoprotein release transport system permease subunit